MSTNNLLIHRIEDTLARARLAEEAGDTDAAEATTREGTALIEHAALAAGLDLDDVRRDMVVMEDELLTAASTMGALARATGVDTFKDVAYALVDDLYDWAAGAHARDLRLGTYEEASGKALLNGVPELRDPAARQRFHAAVETPGRAANPAYRQVALLRRAYPGITADDATLATLLTLRAVSQAFSDAMRKIAHVAGERGFTRTAAAVLAMSRVLRPLNEQAVAIHAQTGTQLVGGTSGVAKASLDAMDEAMTYALANGSDKGFDYAAVNVAMKAVVDAAPPGAPLNARDRAVVAMDEVALSEALEEAA